MTTTLVTMKNIHKYFAVVKDVSFTLQAAEVHVLLG